MQSNGEAGDAAGEATAFSERPANSRLVERDVEAPEVFQITDKGLWDGRPSLGGVWVAYPDVKEPERVIIRNDSNGKFVIGALFKREREHPGPKLQVSSDAAAALEMLAGAPITLDVTALRREEPAPAVEPEPETVAEAEEVADDEAIANAEAAISRAETDAEAGTGADDAVAVATAAPEENKRNWNPFRRKPAAAAGAAVTVTGEVVTGGLTETVASSDEAATVASEALEAVEVAAPVEPVKKKRGWNPFRKKRPEAITPVAATGSAALATGQVTTQSLGAAPRIADEPAAAPEARASAAASKLDRPYVQIGIFSVEKNANDTATALRQNGVVPQVYKQESSGKTFWRVIAGPANTKVDRAALLKKVKSIGFEDAYPVSG